MDTIALFVGNIIFLMPAIWNFTCQMVAALAFYTFYFCLIVTGFLCIFGQLTSFVDNYTLIFVRMDFPPSSLISFFSLSNNICTLNLM